MRARLPIAYFQRVCILRALFKVMSKSSRFVRIFKRITYLPALEYRWLKCFVAISCVYIFFEIGNWRKNLKNVVGTNVGFYYVKKGVRDCLIRQGVPFEENFELYMNKIGLRSVIIDCNFQPHINRYLFQKEATSNELIMMFHSELIKRRQQQEFHFHW